MRHYRSSRMGIADENMRTKIFFIILAFVFAVNSPVPSSGHTYQTDPSIETFWARFKSAVTKADKETIASMSQFPIGMPYGLRTIKSKPELFKRYRDLFNVQANAARCFSDAIPAVDARARNRFTVGCKDAAGNETVVYGFVKTRGIWKLKSLDNINE